MHSLLNFNLLCVFFSFFFFHTSGGKQFHISWSGQHCGLLANCKELNCCEKSQIDVVTLTNFLLNFSKQNRTDELDGEMLRLVLIPHCQYFSFTAAEGAFNPRVLKESTLTYITMLINRTFPFCRRPQRATLSVSVAESPHSLGPHSCFSHVAIYSLN